MNSILTALLNGAIVGIPVTAATWLGLRLSSRRVLNASARYLVWWAALATVAMLPLAFLRVAPAQTTSVAARSGALSKNPEVSKRVAPQTQDQATSTEAAGPSNKSALLRGFSFPLVLRAGAGSKWILTAWAAVSAFMLLRLTASYILLERRKTRAIAAPLPLAKRIDEWLAPRSGAPRQVRLAWSAEISSPMLAGLWRPVILIPQRLIAELKEGELEQIGLHEAAHLTRRDDYALLVQRAVEAVFALHPVVRWITRQIDLEREIACDDVVVATMGFPWSYAECLTRMVELCNGIGGSWSSTSAAGARSHLAIRVETLLDRNRHAGVRPGRVSLAAAIGMVTGLGCMGARTPGVIALAMPTSEVQPSTITPAIGSGGDSQTETDATASNASEAPETTESPSPPGQATATMSLQQLVATLGASQAAATMNPSAVVVLVKVQDPLNRYVTDLSKEDFKVFEDDLEQKILKFGPTLEEIKNGKSGREVQILTGNSKGHSTDFTGNNDLKYLALNGLLDRMATVPGVAASHRTLQNGYALGYTSTNTALDGKYRRLRVEAVPVNGLPLKVIARAGYYAPPH